MTEEHKTPMWRKWLHRFSWAVTFVALVLLMWRGKFWEVMAILAVLAVCGVGIAVFGVTVTLRGLRCPYCNLQMTTDLSKSRKEVTGGDDQ